MLPPRTGMHKEFVWIHRSDGDKRRADLNWLKQYLLDNPQILTMLDYEKKVNKTVTNNPPVEFKMAPNVQQPIPTRNVGQPSWMTAPTKSYPPTPVVAGQLCVIKQNFSTPRKR